MGFKSLVALGSAYSHMHIRVTLDFRREWRKHFVVKMEVLIKKNLRNCEINLCVRVFGGAACVKYSLFYAYIHTLHESPDIS